MKKIIARLFYGMPETGEPVNLKFTPIRQNNEPARGEEAYKQAEQFNNAFQHIKSTLNYKAL